jgi:superfamily II DNA or RNA helicase
MSDIKINKLDEVFLQVECCNDIAQEINEHFKEYVPNYRFMPLYKAKLFDGRISLFNFNNFTLPFGFLKKLKEFSKSYNYSYELTFNEESLKNKISEEEITKFLETILPSTSKFKLRDYQLTAIKDILREKRGLIEHGTGSGKSLLIYVVVKYLQSIGFKEKFVLVVNSISLVEQMRSDFKDYGYSGFDKDFATIYYDSDNRDFSKQYLISTWQTLSTLPQKYLDQFGAFIVDEVHDSSNFKSKMLLNVLSKFTKCSWRIGTTGTLPRDVPINMKTLVGYIGKIISEVKSSELIEKGILSKIQVLNILLKYPDSMIDKDGEYFDEVEKIIQYRDRNKIFKFLINKVGPSKNILILVQRIEHLKSIREYLMHEFPNKKIYEVYGKVEGLERERIRKIVNNNAGNIIVATYQTMSTGVNIPNLNVVIFGSSAKSYKKIVQSIGRGLRKTLTKTSMVLLDIVDDLTWVKRGSGALGINYLYSHFLERLKIYRSQGFPFKNIKVNLSDI